MMTSTVKIWLRLCLVFIAAFATCAAYGSLLWTFYCLMIATACGLLAIVEILLDAYRNDKETQRLERQNHED